MFRHRSLLQDDVSAEYSNRLGHASSAYTNRHQSTGVPNKEGWMLAGVYFGSM